MLIPHFHFYGDCADAITIYEKAFNTKVEELLACYENLKEGSCIVDPFNEAPYCKLGGNFMDKFGVLWGFMAVS